MFSRQCTLASLLSSALGCDALYLIKTMIESNTWNVYGLYCTWIIPNADLNLNLNLLTTTHHNNDSTYERSYNAKNNTDSDTCIHNIRVMSIEQ